MHPIRKPFQLDPVFPFELVYKGIRYSETELPDHLHDMYEVVYVHAGRGTFFIDDALYEKEAGDLFIIPGNTVHRAFPSTNDPIISTAIFFAPSFAQAESLDDGHDPLSCFDIAHKFKRYKIELPSESSRQIETWIEAMADEWAGKEIGHRHAVKLHLQTLLLGISRLPFTKDAASSLAGMGPQWIHEALQRIVRDPVQCGGLRELSAKACVSSAHFSRVFKQLTGMNLTDYVNAKRIIRAKELLRTTDDNIETIALICGFQGLPHFYEAFKKLAGMTPRSYRLKEKLH
ncbi:AraC family transcriptional regulator [Paenibacillus sp. R14(2021)]|uniref:AraC family transcriptional regulator n=1 Tax=Paenibacillus sp. R14(2021) TaxID=2859228 RepID=UPI001C613DC6|nr:AraC family transcriptional regulator [Paenibacillus sp. R14(2021)]